MNAALDLNAEELLAQAAAWRLASFLLERPRPGWQGEIAKLSCEVADRDLAACAGGAKDATEANYHRLFGPAGAVSPREASYCGFEDPGRLMADLNAYYRAFLFDPRREEPIDHIAVEAGFVGYLFLKEAYAEMRGDLEAAAVTRSARERFVADHVARLAQGMLERPSTIPAHPRSALCWIAEGAAARSRRRPIDGESSDG